MERDALIAHGTSFLLQDRLMNCSDYSTAWVCRTCGSLISLGYEDVNFGGVLMGENAAASRTPSGPSGEYCRTCRAAKEEDDRLTREALGGDKERIEIRRQHDLRVSLSSANVMERSGKGGDMDVIAIPYVFRYLCAELASMGIAVSVEVK
jgi:DNA-directed RNA polymerase I subunit RPA2